jgi:hypothetical protein
MLKDDLLFIPKSREMMTSWLSCGVISWMTQWYPSLTGWFLGGDQTRLKVGGSIPSGYNGTH